MPARAERLTWNDVEEHLSSPTLAFLPIGALEGHGPHLPLATDTLMAEAIAGALADRFDGIVLPAMPFGESTLVARYPGTVTVTFDTIRNFVADIAKSLTQGGFRALVVVNGHYGNKAPIDLALTEMLRDGAMPAISLDFPGIEQISADVCQTEPPAPGFYHADEFETSLILHLAPELVDMDKAVAEYPDFPVDHVARPMFMDELSPSGVFGDPTAASADKGRRILELLVENCEEVVTGFVQTLDERKT